MADRVKVRPRKSKPSSASMREFNTGADERRAAVSELEEWADSVLGKPAEPELKLPAKPAAKQVSKPAVKKSPPPLRPKVAPAAGKSPTKPEAKPVSKPTRPPLVLRQNAPVQESMPVDFEPPKPQVSNKKNSVAAPSVSQLAGIVLQETLKAARLEYCDDAIGGAGEVGNLVLGIPMPFIMEYLTQNSVFPLSRVFQLVGQEKSNKSSLTFEMARWFLLSEGFTYLFENEKKYSTDLAESIFGYSDEVGREVLGHHPCKSQEDWQQRMTHTLHQIKYRMTGLAPQKVARQLKGRGKKGKAAETTAAKEKMKPLGRIFPVLFILDSLCGSIAEEKMTGIDSQGFATRQFAIEALHNSDYLKKMASDLVNFPISLVVVNHLKKQKAENSHYMERIKPGGKLLNFQETYEIEMSKKADLHYVDRREDAVAMEINGNRIKLQVMKSGLGEEDREIEVDFMWWYDWSQSASLPEPELRQYSSWKWQAATVELLSSFEGERKAKLNTVVDIRKIKDNEFWSKRLNIPQTKPVSKDQLGALIESDPDLVNKLRNLLAIKRRTIFRPGSDYKKMVSIQAKHREMQMTK